MKIIMSPAADGTEGSSQGTASPELDTAMGGWGEGEGAQGAGGVATQTAPAQTQQGEATRTQAAPAQQATTQQASVKGDPTSQVSQAASTQDTAAIIKAVVESTAAAMTRAQGQTKQMETAQKTMSDEDFAKRYGLTKFDAKSVERLFDKDPAKAAEVLNELHKNAYTAAVRMANDLVAAQQSTLEARYAPRMAAVEKYMAVQTEREATDRFYGAFPALKPESDLVKEVLDATQAKIARGELRFTDEKQAFQYVADATNKVVSRMTSTGAATGTIQQSPPGTRIMAQAAQAARPGGQKGKPSDIDGVMSSWDETPE